MLHYLLRRLLLIIPTLFGITLVVFLVMKAAPGDVADMLVSREGEIKPEQRREIAAYVRQRYGLDQPLVVQYGRWLNKVSPVGFATADDGSVMLTRPMIKKPDLGESFVRRRPVTDLIAEALPVTLLLNLISIPLTYLIALGVGLYAAKFRGKTFDVASSAGMLALWALPLTWVGVLLIGFLANKRYYYWFPTGGLSSSAASNMRFLPTAHAWLELAGFATFVLVHIVLATGVIAALAGLMMVLASLVRKDLAGARSALLPGIGGVAVAAACYFVIRAQFLPDSIPGTERGWLVDRVWHLTLALVCLSYGGFAYLAKLTRSAVLESLQQDYVRTARAKGVSDHHILMRHAFRNSLLPVITVASHILPALLGGSIIVERIFSIPGMGKLAVDSVMLKDQEVVMATTLVGGLLGLLSYVIADIGYALADPRVSYE